MPQDLTPLTPERIAVLLDAAQNSGTATFPIWVDELEALCRMASEAAGLRVEHERNEELFDMRHKADARAIKQWQASAPGRELQGPDHADLVCYLVEKLEFADQFSLMLQEEKAKVEAERDELRGAGDDADGIRRTNFESSLYASNRRLELRRVRSLYSPFAPDPERPLTMTPELREAAERIALHCETLSGCGNPYGIGKPHDGKRYDDMRLLADAVLAGDDDSAEPVTEEWLRSVGLRFARTYSCGVWQPNILGPIVPFHQSTGPI